MSNKGTANNFQLQNIKSQKVCYSIYRTFPCRKRQHKKKKE